MGLLKLGKRVAPRVERPLWPQCADPTKRLKCMKLSRTVLYALQATCQLGASHDDSPVPSKKLAEGGGMPDRFLLQILRNLVAHGVLRSTRGVIGGYALARSPEDISLLDIIEAVEGPVTFEVAQPHRGHDCIQQALEAVTVNIRRDLADLKLSQILPETEGHSNGSTSTVAG